MRAVLTGTSQREETTLEARNRRGKPFECRVTLLPLAADGDGKATGLIMMMEAIAG